MSSFNPYRIFAVVNTIAISCLLVIVTVMEGYTYPNPEQIAENNVIFGSTLLILGGGILASWMLVRESKQDLLGLLLWRTYIKWFFALLPWLMLLYLLA